MVEAILSYIWSAILASLLQIGIFLVPGLVLTLIMNYISTFVQQHALLTIGKGWYLGLFESTFGSRTPTPIMRQGLVEVKSSWVNTIDIAGNAIKKWHLKVVNHLSEELHIDQPFEYPVFQTNPSLLYEQQLVDGKKLKKEEKALVFVTYDKRFHIECLRFEPQGKGIILPPDSVFEWNVKFTVSQFFLLMGKQLFHNGRHFYMAYEPFEAHMDIQDISITYKIARESAALELEHPFLLHPIPTHYRETDKYYIFVYNGKFLKNRNYSTWLILNLAD